MRLQYVLVLCILYGFLGSSDCDQRVAYKLQTRSLLNELGHRENVPCKNMNTDCSLKQSYPNYRQIETIIHQLQKDYPHLVEVTSLGKSVNGLDIYAVEVSDKPGNQSELEPNVKFVATQHGDEVVGTEMVLRLLKYLVENYSIDENVKQLVDTTHIFIVPVMNPDGFERCVRNNAGRIDLNRDFPDRINNPTDTTVGKQPETIAIMNWLSKISFTLSANIHGGDVVVNYPYDSPENSVSTTKDDDIFVLISSDYARSNQPMVSNPDFPNGITNGAAWYALYGGMQDFNYFWRGCMEITLELSCQKIPFYSEIEEYWMENKDSMINFIEQSHRGVKGLVTDKTTQKPINATVKVVGRDFKIYTRKDSGIYVRLLLQGSYEIEASSNGYQTQIKPIFIEEDFSSVILNFQLLPENYKETETIKPTINIPNDEPISVPIDNTPKEKPISVPIDNTPKEEENFVIDEEGSFTEEVVTETYEEEEEIPKPQQKGLDIVTMSYGLYLVVVVMVIAVVMWYFFKRKRSTIQKEPITSV